MIWSGEAPCRPWVGRALSPASTTARQYNDDAIPHGMSYWIKLAETALAA